MHGERTGNVLADESGQDLAEYALLVGLIAIVVITSVGAFGTSLLGMYDNIVETLPF